VLGLGDIDGGGGARLDCCARGRVKICRMLCVLTALHVLEIVL